MTDGKTSFNDESFKQQANKKREELLQQLKTNISESLYEQCHDYFKNQCNLILAEIEKEVEAYLKKLDDANWWVNLALGTLAIVPGGGVIAAVGHGVKVLVLDNLKGKKGYGQGASLIEQEISLTKYGPGKIEVTLCFGDIVICLESKIKLCS